MYELMNPVALFGGALFLILVGAVLGVLMEYYFDLFKKLRGYHGKKITRVFFEEVSQVFFSGMLTALFVAAEGLNALWESWKVQLAVAVILIIVILRTNDSLYEISLIVPLALILVRMSWVFLHADQDKFESRRLHKPTPLPGISKTPYVEKKPKKKVRSSAVYHFKRKGY